MYEVQHRVVARPVLVHEVIVCCWRQVTDDEADGPMDLGLAAVHDATAGSAAELLATGIVSIGIRRDKCENVHVGGGAKVADAARGHVEADG